MAPPQKRQLTLSGWLVKGDSEVDPEQAADQLPSKRPRLSAGDMARNSAASSAPSPTNVISDTVARPEALNLGSGIKDKISSEQRFSETDDFRKLVPSPSEPKRTRAKKPVTQNDDDDDEQASSSHRYRHRHLEYNEAPMKNVYDVFKRMAKIAKDLQVEEACQALKGRPLRIFTACSGTEAPILALGMMQNALQVGPESAFKIHHVGSAEIEKFKAAYIERNFNSDVIFRDVTEFGDESNKAHTIYGAYQYLPKDVDILIAGSACVDYSHLNNAPKEFGEDGESFSTMQGIQKYVKRNEPTILVLENVKTAPWEKIAAYWEEVGYSTKVVSLDSKDYGVPQTRQRGYMFAVNNKQAKNRRLHADAICKAWEQHVKDFEMRASSPYTDWIYSADDPKLGLAKKVLESTMLPPNRQQSWEASSARHMRERTLLALGFQRPLTKWQESGGCQPADYLWNAYMKNQRERILDTVDVNFLRYLVTKGFDATKKSRAFDVSQNVDRDTDSREWGILMCQTPRGMPFDTMRGGPLTGRESCILQGLPVEDLDLTHESTLQLQDLAGNAMTTTVAGAVLVSAIVAAMSKTGEHRTLFADYSEQEVEKLGEGSRHLEQANKSKRTATRSLPEILKEWEGKDGLSKHSQSLQIQKPLDNTPVVLIAAMRRCKCEGYDGQVPGPFFVCMDCGHSVCSTCKGNPAHNFQPLRWMGKDRIPPKWFAEHIKKALPKCLTVSTDSEWSDEFVGKLEPFDKMGGKVENELYQTGAKKALNCTYVFHQIKRDRAWKIEYASDYGTLELHLTPYFIHPSPGEDRTNFKIGVERKWVIIAQCNADVPAGSKLRRTLETPIATMHSNKTFMEGQWKIHNPAEASFTAHIKGIGEPSPAWESSLGIIAPKFRNLVSFPQLFINFGIQRFELPQSLSFTWHVNCSAAQGSLYRSTTKILFNGMKRHLYFFLDPYPLGDKEEDSFILSFDPPTNNAYETRHVIARFEKGWRATVESGSKLNALVECRYVARDSKTSSIRLSPPGPELEATVWTLDQPVPVNCQRDGCKEGSSVFIGVRIPCPDYLHPYFEKDVHYELDLRDRHGRLKEYAYVLKNTKVPQHAQKWQVIVWTDQTGRPCEFCAPETPPHSWQWVRKRKSATLMLRPFTDDEKAAEYEGLLCARPLQASASLDCHEDAAYFELRLNLPTMAHRVVAPFLRRKVVGGIEIEWRVVEYDVLESMPSFSQPNIPNNSEDKPAAPATTEDKHFKRKLWERQVRTVNWMIDREVEGTSWSEQNKIDAKISPMAWSIEVQANVTKRVHGGVLADEVGSGKTTMVLALIHHFLRKSINILPGPSTINQINQVNQINLRASLILVPQNIINQWENQINDCYGANHPYKIVTIRDIRALKANSIKDFEEADIILASWNILESPSYWQALRKLCCAPNYPSTGGRALGEWMEETLRAVDKLVTAYQNRYHETGNRKEAEKAFNAERQEVMRWVLNFTKFRPFKKARTENDDSDNIVAPEVKETNTAPQMAYPNPVERLEGKEALDEGYEAELAGNIVVWALFHLFVFTRVIVDEFTYCTPKTILAILRLSTRSRWLLSGTPPVSSLSGIDAMSRLMGTRVIADSSDTIPFGFGGKAKPPQKINEQTYAEEQLSLSDAISPGCLRSRHEKAHEFVTSFVRQNASPMTGVPTIDHIYVVKSSPVECATYYEVFQVLCNQSMKFNQVDKMRVVDEPNRNKAVNLAIQRSSSAEHALICATAALRDLNIHDSSVILEGQNKVFNNHLQSLYELMRETIHYRLKRHRQEKTGIQADDKLAKYLESIQNNGEYGDAEVTEMVDRLTAVAYSTHKDFPMTKIWRDYEEKLRIHGEKVAAKRETALRKRVAAQKKAAKRKEAVKQDGDEESKLTDDIDAKHPVPQPPPDVGPSFTECRDELKFRVNKLYADTRESVRLCRVFRFFTVVNQIVRNENVRCSICGTERDLGGYSQLRMSAACGHVSCQDCLGNVEKACNAGDTCRKDGCAAAFVDHQLVPLARFTQKETSVHHPLGRRNLAIVQAIKKVPQKDYVIIFVQYEVMKEHLLEALNRYGVVYEDCFSSSKYVEKFKRSALFHTKAARGNTEEVSDMDDEAPPFCPYLKPKKGEVKKEPPQVLILKLDSADSAGWNLQVANHVMFVAPLVAQTQFDYDTIRKQAIGRCHRFGQKKKVHVYDFVMRRTLEVNILEARNSKVVAENRAGKVRLFSMKKWKDLENPDEYERLNGPALDNHAVDVLDEDAKNGAPDQA